MQYRNVSGTEYLLWLCNLSRAYTQGESTPSTCTIMHIPQDVYGSYQLDTTTNQLGKWEDLEHALKGHTTLYLYLTS